MPETLITLSGLSHIVGQDTGRYDDLPETQGVIERYKMTGSPDTWGFGTFRKTRLGWFQMITEVGRDVLARTPVPAAEIDAVYICAATLPFDFETMNLAIGQLLRDLDLPRAVPLIISGAGCAALVQGIVTASREIRSGDITNALLLTTDIVKDGDIRFYQYATISDGACGLLLSPSDAGDLELVDAAVLSRSNLMLQDDQYISGQVEMYRDATAKTFARTDHKVADVTRILSSNLHLPILRTFQHAGGFTASQIYMENVQRLGHCYGSDPIINFRMNAETTPYAAGDLFVLQSSAMGYVGNALVRARRAMEAA